LTLRIRRTAARVILVDHAYRVLLLHVHDPARPVRGTWWELPGGGLRRGEDAAAAAVRELREETGYAAGVRIGPCVWVRELDLPFTPLRQTERIHVAWLDDPHAPRSELARDPVETAGVLGQRWWTLDELAGSDEVFYPTRLPALMPAVVRGEYGAEPVDAGA
jgi:8-oxo-dGTP pyrophosphatase MutT (NUDIX family)